MCGWQLEKDQNCLPPDTGASMYVAPLSLDNFSISWETDGSMVELSINRVPDCTELFNQKKALTMCGFTFYLDKPVWFGHSGRVCSFKTNGCTRRVIKRNA